MDPNNNKSTNNTIKYIFCTQLNHIDISPLLHQNISAHGERSAEGTLSSYKKSST